MMVQNSGCWVLHDYLQVSGGAERLVVTLARGLPGYSLGVAGIYSGFGSFGDLANVDLHELSVARWLPRVPRALWTFGRPLSILGEAKSVIYSGVYAPLAVHGQPGGKKNYYCHTPPRFAFDWEDSYVARHPSVVRPALSRAIAIYRRAYIRAVESMDVVIVNSWHVRERLRRLLGVTAKVVYPPIDTETFRWRGQGDYYLSLGRLEPNKRIDRVVKAFLAMPDKKLVVASGGSQEGFLRGLAHGAPNILFTGWQTEAELAALIGNSIACIYVPRDEDFGMSAVEAMAAGKPVIGVVEGGLKESIEHNSTGLLLSPDPNSCEIARAVRALPPEISMKMRLACESRATEFTSRRFVDSIKHLIG